MHVERVVHFNKGVPPPSSSVDSSLASGGNAQLISANGSGREIERELESNVQKQYILHCYMNSVGLLGYEWGVDGDDGDRTHRHRARTPPTKCTNSGYSGDPTDSASIAM